MNLAHIKFALRAAMLLLPFPIFFGCTFVSDSSLPTIMPTEYIPTAIALTLEAKGVTPLIEEKFTSEPSATIIPQEIIPTGTPLPEISLTASPTSTPGSGNPADAETRSAASPTPGRSNTPTPETELPYGKIQILSPGPASRVASPFMMRTFLKAGPTGRVQIELQGEDGRLLMREIKAIGTNEGQQITIGTEMKFETAAAAEAGRVVVSIEDKFGRIMALASTDVILISLGESDINMPGDLKESIVIEEPRTNALIQGGKVRVSGEARPASDKPLVIELQTTDGRIAGINHMVHVDEAIVGSHGKFSVDVPYSVEEPTRVRLVVWERGDRIPGIVHLSSLEVMLSP